MEPGDSADFITMCHECWEMCDAVDVLFECMGHRDRNAFNTQLRRIGKMIRTTTEAGPTTLEAARPRQAERPETCEWCCHVDVCFLCTKPRGPKENTYVGAGNHCGCWEGKQ